MKHRSEWVALALILAAPLSACIVIGGSPGPNYIERPAPRAARPAAERPQVGTASEQATLQTTGRVQVSFQGLGADGARRSIGAPVSRVLSLGADGSRELTPGLGLLQTSPNVARLEVSLSGSTGFARSKQLGPQQLQQPLLALIFVGVPNGPGTLQATAYDANGAVLSSGSQSFVVEANQLTEVTLAMRGNTAASIGSTISLGNAAVVREANISGYWVVSAGDDPPPFPMVGCGDDYVWSVTQVGSNIKATVSGWNAPDAPQFPDKYWMEEAFGTIRKNAISMSGIVTYKDTPDGPPVGVERAEYQLVYDPVRSRLTGARNDIRGWGVPYIYDCGAEATPPPVRVLPSLSAPLFTPTPPPLLASQGFPLPTSPGFTRVRGTVFGPDDKPVNSGKIEVYPLAPTSPSQRVVIPIKPDGSYEADVPAGTWIEMYTQSGGLTGSYWGIFYAFSDNGVQERDLWLTGVQEETAAPAIEASQTSPPTVPAYRDSGQRLAGS